jgi:phenylpropionate dioxygenase-like ring-hydroxylating dioxygenase large terminal subunit
MKNQPRPLDPNRMPRSPGVTYQQLLDEDTHPVPRVLRLQSPMDFGNEDIPNERYTSRAWFDREVEFLWKRVWQYTCREEEIPEPGDYYKYDIAGMSFLVVRTESGAIKAYPNACLHRGRQLKEYDGHASELRCAFHGFCWGLDGKLKDIPARWDFRHVEDAKFSLPEIPVGRWAGFVFINPDRDCEPFEDHVADIKSQFDDRWPLADLYIESHTAKRVDANWKIAQEAFCEAYHVNGTHPQILMSLGDTNSQVDVWRNCARVITPGGTYSPLLEKPPTKEQMLFYTMDLREGEEVPKIPEGMSVRAYRAATMREALRPRAGARVDQYCDAELVDSIDYTLFPNFHPWGAFNQIVYRFRPNGLDHRSAIMECIMLAPFEGKRPPPAPIHWLGKDESWSTRLGFLGKVFDQDFFNMPKVQLGLEATYKPGFTLASYQESKVRWLHHRIAEFIEEGEKKKRKKKEAKSR